MGRQNIFGSAKSETVALDGSSDAAGLMCLIAAKPVSGSQLHRAARGWDGCNGAHEDPEDHRAEDRPQRERHADGPTEYGLHGRSPPKGRECESGRHGEGNPKNANNG